MGFFIAQTVILIIVASLIFNFIICQKSLKLAKRIGKYSIEPIVSNNVTFTEVIVKVYNNLINNLTRKLNKITFFVKYSKRYNKYSSYDIESKKKAMDYVSNKLVISFFFILFLFISKVFQEVKQLPTLLEIVTFAMIGFYIMDIYLKVSDKIKKKKIEQDLLDAIIIMNNAFRSGRSTIQAIEIVSEQLTGPISQEFKKMHLEINYGLSLDDVFERFSKRVSSEEVKYITSSLSILNKTGGNIIKVFSSIEKMLFNKKKLKQEMKSLTSSSKMVSNILLVMPLVFVLFIMILSPTYFVPLITTVIGRIILFIIILLYISYILAILKIMKVRYN